MPTPLTIIPLTLLLCVTAPAATIIGDMTLLFGNSATNNAFSVYGLDLPMNYNGSNYPAITVDGQLTNGQLNVTLTPPGRYDISFPGPDISLRVTARADTNTYDISQMLTNCLVWVNQGISKYVQPGSGVVFTTNNAGLASEYISITSLGSGGVASNTYQLQITNAGISLSTNALAYIYTLSLNANLQNWSALATSAKQDALGYTPANTNFATTSVPGLAFPDGVTIVIDPTTHQWSSVATGTGDFVGPAGATSGNVVVFGSGTGKSGADSGHALSEYTPLSQIASGSQNGVLSSSDWIAFNAKPSAATAVLTNDTRNIMLGGALTNFGPVILTPGTPADTNAAASMTNVTQLILNNTLDLGPLAPASDIYILGLNSSSNATPVHLGAGLTYDPATSNLNATATGDGSTNVATATTSGLVKGGSTSVGIAADGTLYATNTSSVFTVTNIIASTTNELLLDLANYNVFKISCLTNFQWKLTNATSLTQKAFIYYQQDANGGRLLNNFANDGGLVQTNANMQPTTSGNALDVLEILPGFFSTNVIASWAQNFQPRVPFTNSLATDGGGEGGGGEGGGSEGDGGGGGGGGDMAFVTAVNSVDGPYNGINWEIGMGVTPASTITITAIGRYCYSGDSGIHTLNIRNTSCTVLGTGTVNMSGATPGTWVYVTLGTPVVVTGGTKVFINSVETAASGDHFGYNSTTITTTGIATTQAQDADGCTGHGGQCEGPTNFKYH